MLIVKRLSLFLLTAAFVTLAGCGTTPASQPGASEIYPGGEHARPRHQYADDVTEHAGRVAHHARTVDLPSAGH